jgi:dTDP-4-dehydrorhamnose 3,5-epimerase
MRVIRSDIPGVLIVEPEVFGDERGFFYESYNERAFIEQAGIDAHFVQDNHSRSARDVLRGFHYQIRQPQGKLIRAVAGEIYDVVVDLRKSSRTFGRWTANVLSDRNRRMLWVPPGFAHAFLVTSDYAEMLYKTTDYWAPQHERCIVWNDPTLNVAWPLQGEPVLSAKDRQGIAFDRAELFP